MTSRIDLNNYTPENLHKLDLAQHHAIIAENHSAGTCALCGSSKMTPEDFKDSVSRREAAITATCQVCQDEIFADPEEDEYE